ncbi:hypothetical protein TNCV_5036941 [Trichonephila clavipes]|nr:hypothetical protein TNCV_5036941 [Trichonephila clavipes]
MGKLECIGHIKAHGYTSFGSKNENLSYTRGLMAKDAELAPSFPNCHTTPTGSLPYTVGHIVTHGHKFELSASEYPPCRGDDAQTLSRFMMWKLVERGAS